MKKLFIILAFLPLLLSGQTGLGTFNGGLWTYNGALCSFNLEKQFADAYVLRVEADGGEVLNYDYVVSEYYALIANNDLNRTEFLCSAEAGVRTQIDGSDTLVNKLYDLSSNDNDHVQTVIANMPKLRDNTKGTYHSLELDGIDDYLLSEQFVTGFEEFSYYSEINVPFPADINNGVGGRSYLSGGKGFGFNLLDASIPDTIFIQWQVRDGTIISSPQGIFEPLLDTWAKLGGIRSGDSTILYFNDTYDEVDIDALATINNNTDYHAIGANSGGGFALEGNIFRTSLYDYPKKNGIENPNDGSLRIDLNLAKLHLIDTQLGYEYEYYGEWNPSTEIWPSATFQNYPRNIWKVSQTYNWDGIQFNIGNYIYQDSDTFNIQAAGTLLSEVITDTSRLYFHADTIYWIHADMEELATPWMGYTNWFAITGILIGEEQWENPHVFKGNSPNDLTKIEANPLYFPPTWGAFNSDVDIFLHNDTMNVVCKSNREDLVDEVVKYYLLRSGDTITWDTTKIMSWGVGEINPVSPSFVDSAGNWKIYAINSDAISTFEPLRFTNSELTSGWQSSPGSNSGEPINFIDYPNYRPWHLDVQLHNNKYYTLVNDFGGALYWGWSTDGINFNFQQSPVSQANVAYYRSSFSFVSIGGKEYVRFWICDVTNTYSVQYQQLIFNE